MDDVQFALGLGAWPISFPDAKQLVAGYAFGERELTFKSRSPALGNLPSGARVRCWGYRSFDCVKASPGAGLEIVDLLVVSGLNVELNITVIEAFSAVKDEVSEAVAQIVPGVPFWDLSVNDIAATDEAPSPTGYWLNRAWWLLMSTPGIGPTTTHKVLHHKWPHLFPLLDAKTIAVYPEGAVWAGVLQDLSANAEIFRELEGWFGHLAHRRAEERLTRLRLHDVLLWSMVTGQDVECKKAGASFVT